MFPRALPLALLGWQLWLVGCDAGAAGAGTNEQPVTRCNHLDEIDLGGLFLQNNMWGMDGAAAFEQCVERSGDPLPVSWRWSWPAGTADQVRGYPFLGFGQDPWRPSSTLPELPRTVRDIGGIAIAHDVRTEADGKYNLAFDIWVTSAPGVTVPPESNVTREIMIWLDHSENPLPPAWLVEEVTLDGQVWDFYRGANELTESYVRDYLAFVARTPKLTGTTNVHEFVRYLEASSHILPDEHVRNVFLGNEVWHGTGSTTIATYSLSFD